MTARSRRASNYDLVIVDAPATGHGVGFLQTPRTFANVARVGPIASQAETLDRFLTNQRRTGVAIVALPEEMPVNETATLERDLTSEVGVAVDRIFCNGLYPERFSEDDEQRIESAFEGAEDGARPALRAALSVRRRAVAQREQLARLEELTEASVTTMPFVFEPELGTEHLRELAATV